MGHLTNVRGYYGRPDTLMNTPSGTQMIRIGSLYIDPQQRMVYRNDETVSLGSRAFDLLMSLVEAQGRLLSKDEILTLVWPDVVVEENNIQVHISALRKLFGDQRDRIRTVPGRGYQLVPEQSEPGEIAIRALSRQSAVWGYPNVIGREKEIQDCGRILETHRLLTIVGAGGIGKTTLARALGSGEAGARFGSVFFVELAPVDREQGVLVALARACGIESSDVDLDAIERVLARAPSLVVLDNAEHVGDQTAAVALAVLAMATQTRVVVTSREVLRVPSEQVYSLPPLRTPMTSASADSILECASVRLFFLRMWNANQALSRQMDVVTTVGDICRRLDGIPLAIELAAARATALGIAGVRDLLDDRLQLLTGGHRTALPRHQTLRATFDWSYGFLDERSRIVFRRLSLFLGGFDFTVACAAICDESISLTCLMHCLVDLAEKSLLTVTMDGPTATYRLSESARAYAVRKLEEEGEADWVAERGERSKVLPTSRDARSRSASMAMRYRWPGVRPEVEMAFMR